MKKIIKFFIVSTLVLNVSTSYSQERIAEEECTQYPTNDVTLDLSVNSFSEKLLILRKNVGNFYESLDKSEKTAIQTALTSNQSPIITHPNMQQQIASTLQSLRPDYIAAFDRLKILNDRLDTTELNNKLNEIILCCIDKLSPNYYTDSQNNILARMSDKCYDAYKLCLNRSARDFRICTGAVIVAGGIASFFSFGSALGAALAAQELCIVTHAVKDEDCKEDYEICDKK